MENALWSTENKNSKRFVKYTSKEQAIYYLKYVKKGLLDSADHILLTAL